MMVEPHLCALADGLRTAIRISENLPETDTTLELKSILVMSGDILSTMINCKHFGSRQLEQFAIYCLQIEQSLEDE